MSTVVRWFGRAAVLGLVGGALVVACAKGTDVTGAGGAGGAAPSGDGGGSGTGGGGGLAPGSIGTPCKVTKDCTEGACELIPGKGTFCTQPCDVADPCPAGSNCSVINGAAICIPDEGQLCSPCKSAGDCPMPTDACLTSPKGGDKFCAIDCTGDGACPDGFECIAPSAYDEPADGGADGGDGGQPDGGDAGKPDGGKPDAGKGGPLVPTKWCVPKGDAACPCSMAREGVTITCETANKAGVCTGVQTCKSGTYDACSAATPVAESCNAKDDNCNGKVDEGDPNDLCKAMGKNPPHDSYVCKKGACSIGPCDAGWAQFPAGKPADGCQCAVDKGEPNDTCATATDGGATDDMGAPLTLTGTLSSDTDADTWTFKINDVAEVGVNSYHAAITFTSNPGNEFLMDVTRGDPCADAPTGGTTAVVGYDWCVNGILDQMGEGACGPHDANVMTPANNCNDNSSVYYVRVYRKAGAKADCQPYTISATGHGAATCDFSNQCK